jgi:hypothetical protein
MMFLFSNFFFNFQQSGRQAPVGGFNNQNSLGLCDIMNQKQTKQTEG